MKSDCYFEECKDCIHKEYNNKFSGCLSNRLRLAFHRLLIELPVINKFIDDRKYCHWFEKNTMEGTYESKS